MLALALQQLSVSPTRASDEATDVVSGRVNALPVTLLHTAGWTGLEVHAFRRLLSVRVEVSLRLFTRKRINKMLNVLASFSRKWRQVYHESPEIRPRVSVKQILGLGDKLNIVLVVENETPDDEVEVLRTELEKQTLANVIYDVRIER